MTGVCQRYASSLMSVAQVLKQLALGQVHSARVLPQVLLLLAQQQPEPVQAPPPPVHPLNQRIYLLWESLHHLFSLILLASHFAGEQLVCVGRGLWLILQNLIIR